MEILQQVALAPYTTLGVGGPARYFCTVTTEDELVEALAFARERELPAFVLGGGSNLLVSDAGFGGLVVRIGLLGIERHGETLRAAAGEPWDAFVQYAVDQGLAGIECLAGIPGTVGGTPVQNVGAYGQEVSGTITQVRAYDTRQKKFVELEAAECGFAYRTSVFNTTEKGRYLVTRVEFHLHEDGVPTLKYADLAKRFPYATNPSLHEVANAVRAIRATKGMVTATPAKNGWYPMNRDPNTCSAGSFFRNPVVRFEAMQQIAKASGITVEKIPHWPAESGHIKLPAAWLIEHAGIAKGFAIGRAAISSLHTLALVNLGGASASEIEQLRDVVTARVAERFGVQLEQEPVLLP